MIYVLNVSKNGHFLNPPTQSYAYVIYEWSLNQLHNTANSCQHLNFGLSWLELAWLGAKFKGKTLYFITIFFILHILGINWYMPIPSHSTVRSHRILMPLPYLPNFWEERPLTPNPNPEAAQAPKVSAALFLSWTKMVAKAVPVNQSIYLCLI